MNDLLMSAAVNGEAHALKEPDTFVKLAGGVFSPEDIKKHMEEKND